MNQGRVALVNALLARGAAKVYTAARRTESLADLVAGAPDRVVPLRLDVTQPAQVRQAVAERFGVDEVMVSPAASARAADDPRTSPGRVRTLELLGAALLTV